MTSSADPVFSLGYDAHPYAGERPLYLCGVQVDHEAGLAGHSDADAALHALIDAILGSVGLGDIGEMFPPGDPRFHNIRSTELFTRARDAVLSENPGFSIRHIDMTILCREPRLSPLRDRFRESIATLAGVFVESVSVKFASGNGLGFIGRGQGIAAIAAVTAVR